MKVTLGTIEVTDEERVAIADALDGKETKRKATRDETRDFVLRHGQSWRELLSRAKEWGEDLLGSPDDGRVEVDEHGHDEAGNRAEPLLGSPVDDLLGTNLSSEDEDLL